MCGILGIATTPDHQPGADDDVIRRMRDRMTHRGPDDEGLWRSRNVALAHRRLAVLDPTPAGHQPMITADGRFALVYNGELYNDPELRAELTGLGASFSTGCDTETALTALVRWGPRAIDRFRGMYALALVDTHAQTITLARDPLGIKPLHYWTGTLGGRPHLVFASEIQAILEHPGIRAQPDLVGVSAYLTTIRTTMGSRTMFMGVNTLEPGQILTFDLQQPTRIAASRSIEVLPGPLELDADVVRHVVSDSVTRHLRADVPTCCLLSGGLDSAICTKVASERTEWLKTYCAGDPDAAPINGVPQSDDFAHARSVAHQLGTSHTEVRVDRQLFRQRWGDMIDRSGMPLSTPNEVAINEVARTLRADGHVVTLSGEGADELFAGYDGPLRSAIEHIENGDRDPGLFQLNCAAWIGPDVKAALFNPDVWTALDRDDELITGYRESFESLRLPGDEPLQTHLRFQRRINLEGLLRRLDSATMLESVEGRTPFADIEVAALADSLPMDRRIRFNGADARTKIALRDAFAGDLPAAIVERPKASFPLPFQSWVADSIDQLDRSTLVSEMFLPEAIDAVKARPTELWNLAWPMLNVAMWSSRWWG